MNLNFYNDIKHQPDLQDLVEYLNEPLQKLVNLNDYLKNNKSNLSLYEIDNKVDKIITKHFPNLIENYCHLNLEYRNTTIIKKENNISFTAKDILLKNIAKLIEEIDILKSDINIVYKEVKLEDFVTKDIKINNANNIDYEIESNNKISIKDDMFMKTTVKPYKWTLWGEIDSFLDSHLGQLFMVIAFMFLSTIGVYVVYDKVQESGHAMETSKKMSTNVHDVKIGSYENYYDGKTIIKETTLTTKNDSLSINIQNIPSKSCTIIAKNIQETHPKILKINNKVMIEDGFINERDLKDTCSLDKNTVELIDYKKYM